ncbi:MULTISPECIES: carboxymuconolactone decarboxylase family protein [unclassified Streptomyces]|uniref:carboxymuconolactone decarboxylase family protein n=1 Tax=unclassified Streptomyces TaxID=2593676 RepID=UPI002E12CB80|nr:MULTISPECIES: carboxymuconolactone decarboxylase family protein [unclassified Streptomyces]WSR26431.1 carboxymuconolactone decarboxylase family protein [Streptomyces sp. NBC_01205]
MSRISLSPPRTLLMRIGARYSRRRYGKVLDPGRAYGHNGRVLFAYVRLERRAAKWNALDAGLKHLAVMAAAARINCSWCMDFGYWEGLERGLSAQKIERVPRWREHREAFSELELLVMEYAEAMTETEPVVTDELAADLIARLGEAAFVELTAMVALENLRSRANRAFGLTSQGFSEACEIPTRQ